MLGLFHFEELVYTGGHVYYAYVLYSPKFDKIYIGQTDNLDKRFERHNLGLVRSTKAYLPCNLIHIETFKTRNEAMGKRIKIS
jgi:putative endonuclease